MGFRSRVRASTHSTDLSIAFSHQFDFKNDGYVRRLVFRRFDCQSIVFLRPVNFFVASKQLNIGYLFVDELCMFAQRLDP
jgi:hypothetical protein